MYTVKKFFLGNHKLSDGRTEGNSGFGVVNEKGEIMVTPHRLTGKPFRHLYDRKSTAQQQADYMNKQGESVMSLRNNEALRGAIKAEVRRLMEDDGKRQQYIVKKDGKQVFKGDYGAATKYIYDATGGKGGKGTLDDALTKFGFEMDRTGQRESVRELTVPEKHQLKVARQVLKAPDAMVAVMGGGITKEEARDIIEKLTGKRPKESVRELTVPEKHQLKVARQVLKAPDAMVAVMGGGITKEEARDIIEKLTGKRPKESVQEAEELSRRQQQLLDLVKDAGPDGYEVGPFGHPDAYALRSAGLVKIERGSKGNPRLVFTGAGNPESVREGFRIMMNNSRYGNEEIDTADDEEEANFLYGEYELVYRNGLRAGDTWLWVEDNWGKTIAGKAKESTRYKEQSRSFQDWFDQVDREVSRIAGLGAMDLADQLWHDWYDDGMSPKDAAEEALQNEGFPFQ